MAIMESIKPPEITSKFLVDSTECVNMKLVRTAEDIHDPKKTFQPAMSHQIFGQKENIFGYSNLKINLFYTAGKLSQFYFKTSDETIQDMEGGVKPDDIEEKLMKQEILQAENGATNQSHFEEMIRQDEKFRPSGTKICEFQKGEKTFEIYKAKISDPGFLDWYLRLETFIMWFIDGSRYIDTDDAQWDYYILFEKFKNSKSADQWAVAGFSTVFRFYAYPEMMRPRISQMLVLPPFQKIGLASELLQNIVRQYQTKNVLEITLEDPSDEFQRVRDYNDAKSCLNLREFSKHALDKGFHLAMFSAANETAKINKKQARRVYEILRYKHTPKFDEEKMKKFRIDVKNRLNAPFKNDMLRRARNLIPNGIQLAEEDRKKMLHDEYNQVIEEYEKVIKRLERTEAAGTN